MTLEGGDGVGKTTQAALLKEWLRQFGRQFGYSGAVVTREPGGSSLGEKLRAILLEEPNLVPMSEFLMFQALRSQHLHEVILPALEQRKIVLCDRYIDSTMAYQGYGLGLDLKFIEQTTGFIVGNAVPDLTIILNASASAGLRRSTHRQQMERRGLAFQERVHKGFLAIARNAPQRCCVIPVQKNPMLTFDLVREKVTDALQRRRRP